MEMEELESENLTNGKFIAVGRLSLLPSDGEASTSAARSALAVSNRFGILFLATSKGFSLAKTEDLVQLASTSKDGLASASEKYISTIEMENVYMVVLSKAETILAVCTDHHVQFYHVYDLVQKNAARPFQEVEENIKDFKWSPTEDSRYMLLTSKGRLSVGVVAQELTTVADGVTAACWSPDGTKISYSLNLQLNIVTSELSKVCVFNLPNDLPDLEDEDYTFEVDGLCWITSSATLVSYIQTDGTDVISSPCFFLTSEGDFCEGSKLTVVTLYGGFPCVNSSMVEPNSGPYLLANYIHQWKIILATSRMSTEEHILVLGLSDASGNMVSYEFEQDFWKPFIPKIDDSEDNVLTGLAVDRTSPIQLPDPQHVGEMSCPSPNLLCTTLDQKLCLFSFVRSDAKENVLTSPASIEIVKPAAAVHAEKEAPKPAPATQSPPRKAETKPAPAAESTLGLPAGFSASKTVNELRKQPVSTLPAPRVTEMPKLRVSEAPAPRVADMSVAQTPAPRVAEMPVARVPEVPKVPVTEVSNARVTEKTRTQSSGLTEMEVNFMVKMDKLQEMSDEIDQLMSSVVQKNEGGGPKAPFRLGKVQNIERSMSIFATKCKEMKRNLQDYNCIVEELRDQSFQVDAWRIYVKSLVEQITDERYQDLWIQQRLPPEMDIKRKHVISADQALKRQITDLESHLHVLELNQRHQSSKNSQPTSSNFQSLQSLYSTVNSQLEAAEQLSSRLANLMELMNVPLTAASQKTGVRSNKRSAAPARSVVSQDGLSTPAKSILSSEDLSLPAPESSRRRRDSIDAAWAGKEATKTTVKRAAVRPLAEKSESDMKLGPSVSRAEPKRGFQKSTTSELKPLPEMKLKLPELKPTTEIKQLLQAQEPKPTGPFFKPTPEPRPVSVQPTPEPKFDFKPLRPVTPSTEPKPTPTSKAPPAFLAQPSQVQASPEPKPTPKPAPELKPAPEAKPTTIAFKFPELKPSTTPFMFPTMPESLKPQPTPIQPAPTPAQVQATPEPRFPAAPKIEELRQTPPPSSAPEPKPAFKIQPTQEPKPTPSIPSVQTTPEPKPTPIPTPTPSIFSVQTTPEPKPTPTPTSTSSSSTLVTPFKVETKSSMSVFQLKETTPQPTTPISAPPPKIQEIAATQSVSVIQAESKQALPAPQASPFMKFAQAPPQTPPLQPLVLGPQTPIASPQAQPSSPVPAPAPAPQDDNMEEEATPASTGFSGFLNLGLGGSPAPAASKPMSNPFGVTTPQPSPFGQQPSPPGQLFRPAAFALPSASPPQQATSSAFSSNAFGGFAQSGQTPQNPFAQSAQSPFAQTAQSPSPTGGFGQPAAIGSGQQALGNALGAFGQTRQVGFGMAPFGAPVTPTGFTGAGFANAASGSGGFGAFSQKQGAGGFAGFAGVSNAIGGAPPPSGDPRFTMRK